jgi:AbrB family looped-hinge helix DNA binding protein
VETTKLSSKGQVVLPKPVRETLGWTQGMEFRIEANEQGVLLRPLRCFQPTTLREVIGSAGYSGRRMTTADMQSAIRKGLKGRRAHGRYDGRR